MVEPETTYSPHIATRLCYDLKVNPGMMTLSFGHLSSQIQTSSTSRMKPLFRAATVMISSAITSTRLLVSMVVKASILSLLSGQNLQTRLSLPTEEFLVPG